MDINELNCILPHVGTIIAEIKRRKREKIK